MGLQEFEWEGIDFRWFGEDMTTLPHHLPLTFPYTGSKWEILFVKTGWGGRGEVGVKLI